MAIHGQCFCGAVQIEIDGDPIHQVFCHCKSCREWSGQPVTASVMFARKDVHFVKGLDWLHRHTATGEAEEGRFSCVRCGGSVGAYAPKYGEFDIYAGVLRDFSFAPTSHINYGERVIDMPDGLPKFRDMPAQAGGSGALVKD